MGLVFSFSSVIGLLADLTMPSLLKGFTVQKLVFWAGILGLGFLGLLVLGSKFPLIWIFLTAMALWGVYYEFLGFGSQQFIADAIPLRLHASGWAILGTFKNLAYFLGPLIAGWLLFRGDYFLALIVGIFVGLGLLILFLTGKKHERPVSIEISEVNLIKELSHWRVLFVHVWPIILMSVFLGLIDATFWTTGAVWTEALGKQSIWGNFILPAYQLPALFMGFVVAKWGIFKGKKKMALKFMMVAALFLMLLFFELPVFLYIVIVLMSSMMLGVTYPLTDAVYSDIVARMGRERKHLIGFSSSTSSLAYIIGPILAGLIAGIVGERMTFGIAGVITFLMTVVLMFLIPKKLYLPEKEIDTWDREREGEQATG
jgi:MFS family permease